MPPDILNLLLNRVKGLTRHIVSHPPSQAAALHERFSPPTDLLAWIAGVDQWWYTQKGVGHCEALALLAIEYDHSLRGEDPLELCEILRNTLQKNVWNKALFDAGLFFSERCKTLFDARAIKDVDEFSQRLWEIFYRGLLESMTTWLVIYPLHGVNVPSFRLGHDGIFLLSPSDTPTVAPHQTVERVEL